MNHERILLVDEDQAVLKLLKSKLSPEGYEVVCCADTTAAMHAAQEKKPDLMILELSFMNDGAFNGIMDGFSLLHWMRYALADSEFPVIVHAADTSASVERQAAAAHVHAVFHKGDPVEQVVAAVREALDARNANLAAVA